MQMSPFSSPCREPVPIFQEDLSWESGVRDEGITAKLSVRNLIPWNPGFQPGLQSIGIPAFRLRFNAG
jgi:hypothetical protein